MSYWPTRFPFIAAIEGKDLWLSPAVILSIGAIMTWVSLLFSPETKDLELDEVGEKEATAYASEAERERSVAIVNWMNSRDMGTTGRVVLAFYLPASGSECQAVDSPGRRSLTQPLLSFSFKR